MQVRFARYLYVPETVDAIPSSMAHHVAEALREVGLAAGPSGEGLTWKPFRPAGELQTYSEKLGLGMPTLNIEWYAEPTPVLDRFLPTGKRYCRCPTCQKLIPADGSMIEHPISGEMVVVEITHCISCGEPNEGWDESKTRVVCSSAFTSALLR